MQNNQSNHFNLHGEKIDSLQLVDKLVSHLTRDWFPLDINLVRAIGSNELMSIITHLSREQHTYLIDQLIQIITGLHKVVLQLQTDIKLRDERRERERQQKLVKELETSGIRL